MSDPDHGESPGGLEAGFAALERRLVEADRLAAAAHAVLRKAGRAAREGQVAALPDTVAQAGRMVAEVAAAVEAVAALPVPDVGAALQDGRFIAELKAAAAARGVHLIERDGRISAFPSVVRLEPRMQAVRFGKRLERKVRPSFLAGLLQAAQQRPERFQTRGFLERLFAVYRPLAAAIEPGWKAARRVAGPLVPLLDLHALLTVLPAAANDYPEEAFAADLLRLDRVPDAATGQGWRFALAAGTGTKGRKRLTVFDEHGGQHEFFAIRFFPEPEHAGNGDARARPG